MIVDKLLHVGQLLYDAHHVFFPVPDFALEDSIAFYTYGSSIDYSNHHRSH